MSVDVQSAPTGERTAAPPRSRIVITGSCNGLSELLETIAGHAELEVRGWCEEIDEAAGLLAANPVAVLHALHAAAVPEAALARIREHTQAPVILVAPAADTELLEQPRSHVAASLRLPSTAEQVAAAVRAARTGGETERRRVQHESRTLTVFSPKGGTGKSVIAANLAVALAAEGVRTLLVDLQLERGDAALLLGLDPERTIYDLVHAPGELDTEKVVGYTMRHSSGLDVLPAPVRPEQAELVSEAAVERVLRLARQSYAAIVVDTPASFDPTLLAALDQTDELLLLCELDVTTLKNARMTLETLGLLEFPQERTSLVLNQTGPARAMKRSELEAGLGVRVRFEVPYDTGVPAAVGRGAPLVLERGDFSRALAKVAWELVPKAARARARSLAPAPEQNGAGSARRSRWATMRRR